MNKIKPKPAINILNFPWTISLGFHLLVFFISAFIFIKYHNSDPIEYVIDSSVLLKERQNPVVSFYQNTLNRSIDPDAHSNLSSSLANIASSQSKDGSWGAEQTIFETSINLIALHSFNSNGKYSENLSRGELFINQQIIHNNLTGKYENDSFAIFFLLLRSICGSQLSSKTLDSLVQYAADHSDFHNNPIAILSVVIFNEWKYRRPTFASYKRHPNLNIKSILGNYLIDGTVANYNHSELGDYKLYESIYFYLTNYGKYYETREQMLSKPSLSVMDILILGIPNIIPKL